MDFIYNLVLSRIKEVWKKLLLMLTVLVDLDKDLKPLVWWADLSLVWCINGWLITPLTESWTRIYFHYSDMASMDEFGYLYIYGRLAYAQRWKVGSDVVYSLGIETVLRSHPKITACVVRLVQYHIASGHGCLGGGYFSKTCFWVFLAHNYVMMVYNQLDHAMPTQTTNW